MLKITYVYYLKWIAMQYSNYTVIIYITYVWLIDLCWIVLPCTMTDACYSMHIMLMYILYNVFLLMLTIPISKRGVPQMIHGMQNKLQLIL